MERPQDIPNMQRLTLAVATESAQDLAPLISAVSQAKAVWDVELAAGGSLDTAGPTSAALTAAGLTLATTTGTALYTDMATLIAGLPAPLNAANGEGDPNVDQTTQFQIGNMRGYTEFLTGLRAPVYSNPSQPGDDDDNEAQLLLDGIQLVYDLYETLTTNRGFTV